MELNISEIEDIPENNVPNPIRVIKKTVSLNKNEIQQQSPIQQQSQPSYSIKAIPKPYAKMVRQQMPEQKPKVSYDDILKNMGMVVVDGKVHLIPNINKITNQTSNTMRQVDPKMKQNKPVSKDTYVYQEQNQYQQQSQYQEQNQYQQQSQYQEQNPQIQNSYIYNKYFNDEKNEAPSVRVPRNIYEYRDMLLHDILQKQRIKQIKSTKMVMPNSNINFSGPNPYRNLNRLFDFSKRI